MRVSGSPSRLPLVHTAERVVDGIRFGEGPVWCPAETPARTPGGAGTLVVTSVPDGKLFRIWPDEHRSELLAETKGGPNGAALAEDGSIVVTQNGGIDFAKLGAYPDHVHRPITPGLQLVAPSGGKVQYLADVGFTAPNDLVVDAQGTIWFTDPPQHPPPEQPIGRVWKYEPDGNVQVVRGQLHYPNGIAIDREGELVIVEGHGLLRVAQDGSEQEWVVPDLGRGGGDGFCVDVDGNFYVASTAANGIRVFAPDGVELDFYAAGGPGVVTNCCFGGADLRTLYATVAMPGHVVAWEGMPVAGRALHLWRG
jgi:gluconolactonase